MSIAVNLQSFTQERLVKYDVNVEKASNLVFFSFSAFYKPVSLIKLKPFYYKKLQSCFDFCEQYFKQFYSNKYQSFTENQSADCSLAVPHYTLSCTSNDNLSCDEIAELGIQECQVTAPYSSRLNPISSESKHSVEELFTRHNCNHSYFDQPFFQGEITK